MVLLSFAFFLRTMELLSLRKTHVRIFQDEGAIMLAIINSKNSRGLQQQSLSLREPGLAAVLSFLLDRARPSGLLYEPSRAFSRARLLPWSSVLASFLASSCHTL